LTEPNDELLGTTAQNSESNNLINKIKSIFMPNIQPHSISKRVAILIGICHILLALTPILSITLQIFTTTDEAACQLAITQGHKASSGLDCAAHET
jgi:hypothetical protein